MSKTIVFVTHDVDEAVRLGDQIAIFRTGGHLVQCAPPAELLARPADDLVTDLGALLHDVDSKAKATEEGEMQNALTVALPGGL